MGTAHAGLGARLARGGGTVTTYSLQLDHDVTHIERVDDLISELVHLATQIDKPQGELHTARSRMSSAARVVSRAESRVKGTAHLGIQRDAVLGERSGDVVGRRAVLVGPRLASGAVRRHGDD